MPKFSVALLNRADAIAAKPARPSSAGEPTPAEVTRGANEKFLQSPQRRDFETVPDTPFRPTQGKRFSDDVTLEAYTPSDLSLAGKLRNAIHEAFDNCHDMMEHVRRAVPKPFLSASGTSLPEETPKADGFDGEQNPSEVAAFRGSQMAQWGTLSEMHRLYSPNGQRNRPSIRPDAIKVRTQAFKNLARQLGLRANYWLGQFAVGFLIIGALSQEKAFLHKTPKGALSRGVYLQGGRAPLQGESPHRDPYRDGGGAERGHVVAFEGLAGQAGPPPGLGKADWPAKRKLTWPSAFEWIRQANYGRATI